MKKIWKYAILLVALSALLCMSAFAADGLTVTAINGTAKINANQESFTASYDQATAGSQYLIIMLAGTETTTMPDPTDGNILYVNQDAAGEDGVVKFETVYPMALEDSVIWLTGGPAPIALASIDVPEPVGVTVSGTVTSYLNDTDTVTVELWADGAAEAAHTASGVGMAYEYALEGVAPGTYTMKVSKNNHVTREYTVIVADTDVTQDAKIHPVGDVTGDGAVKMADYLKVLAQSKGIGTLTGYELKCADVTGDGAVKMADYLKVLAHSKGVTLLW